jgi:hypothetical protein
MTSTARFPLSEVSRGISSIEIGGTRGWERAGHSVFNGDSGSVWEDEKSWRWTVVMAAQHGDCVQYS